MNLGLLLIPALGGYYLLARCFVSRYWVARQSGYALFFSAAIAGALLLFAARLVAVLLPLDPAGSFLIWWGTHAPFEYAGTVLVSALLALVFAEAINLVASKHRWARKAARAGGDLIECLIQEAVESKGRQLVEVSTKSSKCYIGFAQESGVTASGEPDIAIVPLASGYRDGRAELRITTHYLPALMESELELAEFRVVIPLAEVASARRFDPDAYKILQRTNSIDRPA